MYQFNIRGLLWSLICLCIYSSSSGVRELFAEENEYSELRRRKRTRADMYKNITPDYYGYRDEDDGILVEKEAIKEVSELNSGVSFLGWVENKMFCSKLCSNIYSSFSLAYSFVLFSIFSCVIAPYFHFFFSYADSF